MECPSQLSEALLLEVLRSGVIDLKDLKFWMQLRIPKGKGVHSGAESDVLCHPLQKSCFLGDLLYILNDRGIGKSESKITPWLRLHQPDRGAEPHALDQP